MRSSRGHHQIAAAVSHRANETHESLVRPNRTQALEQVPTAAMLRANQTQPETARPEETQSEIDADALASELFDRALIEAGLDTSEVAYLLGISESVVRRLRSKDARERVSFAQLLILPEEFHLALHRQMNRRFGYGRAALGRILDDLGVLALAVGR